MKKLMSIIVVMIIWYCIGFLYHVIRSVISYHYDDIWNPLHWDAGFVDFYGMIGAFALLLAIVDQRK
jgi:hypothetical protein